MHDKSQVQDKRREDAAPAPNTQRGFGDSCICGKTSISYRGLRSHKRRCKEFIDSAILSGDLIRCKLCEYIASKLSQHVKNIHSISPQDYARDYGPVVAPGTASRYSAVAKSNGDWINRAKENGTDLSEYKEKLSKSLSKSIMENQKERERRSRLLGSLNKTAAFRKKSSDTAKITSARPDVIRARSLQLKKWRDNNPDQFYKKCTAIMHKKYQTLPEKKLFEFCKSLNSNFESNKQIKSVKHFLINKTASKQIDILDKEAKILLEFDGVYHFRPIFGEDNFKKIKSKDLELNKYCLDNNYLLIRISQSCFIYKNINDFDIATKDKISYLIKNQKPGIHFIGSEYNV